MAISPAEQVLSFQELNAQGADVQRIAERLYARWRAEVGVVYRDPKNETKAVSLGRLSAQLRSFVKHHHLEGGPYDPDKETH